MEGGREREREIETETESETKAETDCMTKQGKGCSLGSLNLQKPQVRDS